MGCPLIWIPHNMVHFTLWLLLLLRTHHENLPRDGTRADFRTDVFSVLRAHSDAFVITLFRNVCNAIIILCLVCTVRQTCDRTYRHNAEKKIQFSHQTRCWNRDSRENGEQPASDWSHRMRRMAACSGVLYPSANRWASKHGVCFYEWRAWVRWGWTHVCRLYTPCECWRPFSHCIAFGTQSRAMFENNNQKFRELQARGL